MEKANLLREQRKREAEQRARQQQGSTASATDHAPTDAHPPEAALPSNSISVISSNQQSTATEQQGSGHTPEIGYFGPPSSYQSPPPHSRHPQAIWPRLLMFIPMIGPSQVSPEEHALREELWRNRMGERQPLRNFVAEPTQSEVTIVHSSVHLLLLTFLPFSDRSGYRTLLSSSGGGPSTRPLLPRCSLCTLELPPTLSWLMWGSPLLAWKMRRSLHGTATSQTTGHSLVRLFSYKLHSL